ncbi:pyridoxamine 5'-phosphate oxidase family protein [Streptomyces sp. NPDC046909]|uniref:pyridoxamine 5'-phosphate oxidase family protein n=1 Tax=Streptomyces sp. NPDC046909 TaxID=3155617 RepID=UPI0033E7C47C
MPDTHRSDKRPDTRLDPRYSDGTATAADWSEALKILTETELFWISTVRPDGRPHVTPLPAVWSQGALHFCTGPEERKALNLAANPNVVLTTGVNTWKEVEVREGYFQHGGGRALVFSVAPRTVFGFGKGEPFSQTRWRFEQVE